MGKGSHHEENLQHLRRKNALVTRVVVIGGGPGGYEAALVAAQQGAEVTLIESGGIGGAAVLTDCVPSKTLVATARSANLAGESGELGVRFDQEAVEPEAVGIDLPFVFNRIKRLAVAQSQDIAQRLRHEGVQIIEARGRIVAPGVIAYENAAGEHEVPYDQLLIATGARPRELPGTPADGRRILNWQQVWDLEEVPEHLIVVGSGVTGAEFAGAFSALGTKVTLVSSRARVLPSEDPDAADVVESVFHRKGMELLANSRAATVTSDANGATVTLTDGRVVQGSHVLVAVGAIPNSDGLGLDELGVQVSESGHITVDRVSRTNVLGVYAAGDVTGVLALASVAAMQGRIAMWHAFGDSVHPLRLKTVSSAVFTDPEIASVGIRPSQIESGEVQGQVITQQLDTNPRAKMQGFTDGFIKLVAAHDGLILGGVVVAPRASDLIHVISLCVNKHLTVDELVEAFTVYPSMSGSIAEAARRLHRVD